METDNNQAQVEIKKEEATILAPKKTNELSVPIAIVVAGIFIAGAIYFSPGGGTSVPAPSGGGAPNQPSSGGDAGALDRIIAISKRDYIRGNPDAPVKIVEYSDMECPFCKRFHGTLQEIMNEYEKDGRVAWVYRHFPLDALHPVKARREAVASECAGELGGQDAFWRYLDRFFELTPSNNQTDIDTVLPQIAGEIGLNASDFSACFSSGRFDDYIEASFNNAIETGGNGTPWSIIVSKGGKKYPVSGALPYSSLQELIEQALKDR